MQGKECGVLCRFRLSHVHRTGCERLMAESKLKTSLAVARTDVEWHKENMVHLATQRFTECGVVYGRHQSV